jgi:ribosomal-protein-alanine N-acetyltransferase
MTAPRQQAAVALRPLSGLDLDRAAFIYGAAFAARWEQRWDRQAFAELLAMPGAFGLMAELKDLTGEDASIGLLLMQVAADQAEIITLAVLPQWRRRGIGFVLMRRGESEAMSRGAQQLFLEVAEDNFAARKLYGDLGFIAVGRRAGYYDRGSLGTIGAITMAKKKLTAG